VESTAYYVITEALKLTSATVTVNARQARDSVTVELDAAGALTGELTDLEDRVGALDGRLEVQRSADHALIRVELPCES
jgi:hypothetical protein